MVSTPEPGIGQAEDGDAVQHGLAARLDHKVLRLKDDDTADEAVLEKSSIFGPSAFLFQKKPETGVLTGHSRASVSSSANARPEALRDPGKRGRFMEGDLLKMRCH